MKIQVFAKPLAQEENVERITETRFVVSVKEPPEKGKANRAVARALAAYFGAASSRVHLASGFSSRRKIFEIET